MSRLAYFLIIKPLSFLPLRLLYVLSDIIYLIISKVIKYRKDLVTENITNSFPNLSKTEYTRLIRRFYQHFSDMIIESLRLFSMSSKELSKRMEITNPEVLDKYFNRGQNLILVAGHYNNWEMLAICMNTQIKHRVAGIYTPLTNPFFETKFSASRTRLGTILVSKYKVKEFFKRKHDSPMAIVFGADQSPQFLKENTYWTQFLNQDTPVMFGTEKYAVEQNLPVFFMAISKVKRGYYKTTLTLIEENPVSSEYCSITEKHTRMLEKQILENPESYLWTHNRWKHKRVA